MNKNREQKETHEDLNSGKKVKMVLSCLFVYL